MVKQISDSSLKKDVLRDTAALMQIVVDKIADVKPTMYTLSLPVRQGKNINIGIRSEGAIQVLNMGLTQLQADLKRLKGKIGESIKTLKRSLV